VKTFSKIEASNAILFSYPIFFVFVITLLLLTVVAIFIGKFVFQPLVLVMHESIPGVTIPPPGTHPGI
jgi:hypothetical protein